MLISRAAFHEKHLPKWQEKKKLSLKDQLDDASLAVISSQLCYFAADSVGLCE
jgi:hypothetical protein